MFLRVRTRLPDSPGALANLARCLGDVEVNILALQIYPDLGTVTDDLVVKVPDAVSPGRLIELAESVGCTEVTVAVCSEQELQDQPTQWLSAVRRLIDDPTRIHAELTGLLGPRVTLSPTEQVRAAALTDIAAAMSTPEEFLLTDLQSARSRFDEIVGVRTSDDVLRHIFERFCIGK